MKKVVLLLLICNVVSGQIRDDILPVSAIKPGMRGYGKTVFSGDKIESFDFEVLDIIPNFKPKRDLILVKLVGEKVEHTNVVAGMSGSPTYIDGKLIGALSYGLGIFLKEPIGGIIPIEQMLEILDREQTRDEELAFNRGFNPDYLDIAVGTRDVSFEALVPPALARPMVSNEANTQLQPLQIPLLFSGCGPQTLQIASGLFSNTGLQIYNTGGGTIKSEGPLEPLQPGSAYAVVLVDGDMELQATGTVTYVDKTNVIGMGHPFTNLGAVGLPMAHVKILTTISSYMASTKLSAVTDIVGSVHQDRLSGVMGVEGEHPQMIPLSVSVQSGFAGSSDFHFNVAKDRSLNSLTPLILGIVITNALESARMSLGNQTLKLDGGINLEGYPPIQLTNYYAGSNQNGFLTDAIQAAGEVASTVGSLLSNDFETPDIESIDLKFVALPKRNLATIQQIEASRTVVEPGDEITITAYVQEFQGAVHRVSRTLKIPEDLRARRISIYAGSGATLTVLEARTTPQKFRPNSFPQLLDLLNDKRKNNFVFFQIRQPDAGILVEGQELPGLPPSLLSVIRSQKSSGNIVPLRDRILVEEPAETEYAVSGGRSLILTVKPKS